MEGASFDDGEFDFVICRQVLEHVADPVRAASELSRVARRGFIEVPSRAGDVNGNPTHRWIVDLEGDVMVFHPRCFVEHPFDNSSTGGSSRTPRFATARRRGTGTSSTTRSSSRRRLLVRVEKASGPRFDYDDPAQAGRSHYSFARNCLLQGADPGYALPDAMLAAQLLPGGARAAAAARAVPVRLLQLDEALETLQGLDDNASHPGGGYRGRRAGEPIDLREIPVPDPLHPAVAARNTPTGRRPRS